MNLNNDISDFSTRVEQIRTYSGLNKAQFSAKIGISPQYYSGITGGDREPGLSVVRGILYAFVEVNPRWLITGEGDMLSAHDPSMTSDAINAMRVELAYTKDVLKELIALRKLVPGYNESKSP